MKILDIKKKNERNLKILYTNPKSLRNKIFEQKLIADKYKVICIPEINLSADNVKEVETVIANFNFYKIIGNMIQIWGKLLFMFITR